MRTVQGVWPGPTARQRTARRRWLDDLFVVALVCVIFGLEIVAVMQTAGGRPAYAAMAAEGMQAE